MIWLVNNLIVLLLTFWYAMIQYRRGKLRWIPLCICSFKPIIFKYCYDALRSKKLEKLCFIYLWIQYKYKEHKRKDYPSKIWPYHVQNPKCGDWCWTNFQIKWPNIICCSRLPLWVVCFIYFKSARVSSIVYQLLHH